jgi:hypothetical protein
LNLNGRNLKKTPVEKSSNGKITGVPVVQLQLWSKGVPLDKNLPCSFKRISFLKI